MYLSNPDSLSGQILSRHELSDLVARLPPSWQLVLDLTHASPSDETALGVRELLTAHKNVWVVRDGRGVHGLPQLSATLLQAHPEALGRVQDVWTHADASTCVALAKAWEDRAFRTQWHKLVLTRRQQAVRELRERGFSVTAGQGPFMLVLLPPERVAFGHRLSEVLPEFVWITMGDSCGWRIPVARRELWNQWMQILDTTWTQLYGTF
jgi:histidinol-phosphate/aromatic aminotransferase/cobyric acid decarboxylase-like protein